jgi:hypothetical protein
MTLGQLRTRLAQYLGLDTTSSDGLVAYWDTNLLNKAADDIGAEYRLPRKTVIFSKADLQAGPVNLPTDFRDVIHVIAPPTVLLSVLDEDLYLPDPNGKLPIEAWGDGMAVIVRSGPPKTLSLVKHDWVDPPEGGILVRYWASYAPMVNDTDTPWGGALDRFHPVIAARAAVAAQGMEMSDQADSVRAQLAKADQDKYMEYLLESLDGPAYLTGGGIRALMYNRRGARNG